MKKIVHLNMLTKYPPHKDYEHADLLSTTMELIAITKHRIAVSKILLDGPQKVITKYEKIT
jgi:hypothetical protein